MIKLNFKKLNPNSFHQELINANIIPIMIEHDRNENNIIADNIYCTFSDDVNIDVINKIVLNHNPALKNEPTSQEKLNAQILQQNAEMQIQIEQQKQLNAQILLQLAGGITNV